MYSGQSSRSGADCTKSEIAFGCVKMVRYSCYLASPFESVLFGVCSLLPLPTVFLDTIASLCLCMTHLSER